MQLPLVITRLLPPKAQAWQPLLSRLPWSRTGRNTVPVRQQILAALAVPGYSCPQVWQQGKLCFLLCSPSLLSCSSCLAIVVQWGGWCLHLCLDPCREMKNACPQPGSVVHIPCGITHQASHEFSVCHGSSYQPSQWGHTPKGGRGRNIICASQHWVEQCTAHMSSLAWLEDHPSSS